MGMLNPRWGWPALIGWAVITLSMGGQGCAEQSAGARAGASDAATLRAGEAVFYQCVTCHTVTEDGGSLTGPNLWGVFGRPAGSGAGFAYSAALKASDIIWTDATMDQFLKRPSSYIPETTMAFVGLPRDEDRAALIAYLRKATGG